MEAYKGKEVRNVKKKVFSKSVSWILSVVMIFGVIFTTGGQYIETSIPVNAVETLTFSDYEYAINSDNTVTITKYIGSETNVSIPSAINGMKVTEIGSEAFWFNDRLKSVVIPDDVIYIKDHAFYYCKKLETVNIPISVKEIEDCAFCFCKSLTNITISDNVTWIGYDAFCYCDSLPRIDVNINNGVYSSYNGVLFNKNKTKLICCPAGQTGSYTIPDSVTSVEYDAFRHCTGLTSITIPDSVTSIGYQAFYGCSGLTSIDIPQSVKSIAERAFISCTGLTSVTIPNSVTKIEKNTFSLCTGLITVNIPDSIVSIGDRSFSVCTNLKRINVSPENNVYASEDGVLLNKSKTKILVCPGGKEGAYTTPNSVISIEDEAFYNCVSLTSVNISNSVTSIGNSAFCGCYKLTDATISNSVTFIGTSAFASCYCLESIVIPNSITQINDNMFYHCDSLTSITIPGSVTKIGEDVFKDCKNFTIYCPTGSYAETYAEENSIPFDAIEENNASDFEYETGTDGFITITKYKGNDAEVVVPGEIDEKIVKRIGYAAFNDCTDLVSVTIPDGVTDIGVTPSGVIYSYYGTFKNCTNLVSVKIPDSVSYIGNGTFAECSSLREVRIPDGITSIGDGLFEGCQSLKSVTIPRKATSIGQAAFERCSGLTSLTIPSGIEYIADYAFYFCTGITHIDLPDSVTDIGSCAFRMCKGLKMIVIPASVTSIGSEAFKGCDDLTVSGEKGSYAETYANDNGIPFKALSEEKISVTSLTITLSQTVFTYDDSEKKPAVTVTDGTKTLVKGTDYTLSYENNTEAGTAYAVINGTGSYGDTARIPYTINKRSAASLTITLSQTVFTYDGSEKKPAVTVTDGTKTLVKGTDYTLSYSDYISAGTGRVTVKGINNYTGEQSKTFSIGRRSLENAVLTIKPGSFTYDGERKKPTVTVSLDGKALTTEDYAVVYSNNVNAGTAKVVVNGRINYNGSVEKPFKISPLSITPFSIALESDTYTYDGNPKTPMVTVTNGTKKLTQGTDFTVAYSDNISEGIGYVTVKGNGNYSGVVKKSFTIEPPPKISISDLLITVNASFGIVYNGEPRTPEVIIQKGKTRLKEGTDFRCTYSDNINAGTAGIEIEGIGKYTGTVTKSFKILPMSIAKASVSVAEDSIIYNGRVKTPGITVKLNGKTLARGTDFSVTYSNNTNIGTSIVTITGKNNFTGQAYGKFAIVSGKKDFVWGQDNYNFINSSSLGYFPKMTYRSMMSKAYLDVLANKYTLTNKEFQTVFIGNGEKCAWLDEPFNGACYGMASTALLAKAGFLNPENYLTGAKYIYDLNYPKYNEKLCSLIIYYHMIQVKSVIQQQYKKVPMMSNEAVIKGIRELLDKNSLVLIGFKKEDWGGHAIVAYGYDNDIHIKNGKTYNGRIWIYDPNESISKNEDFFIYYNSFDNYSWTIPGYARNSDISSGAGARFNYYGASVDDINSGGYLFRVNKSFNNSQSDYVARIDAHKLSGDGRVNKVSADPSGNGAYMNTASAPGEIVADYSYILAGEGTGTMGYNLYDSSSAYKVSQDMPAELDLSIDYEYCDLSARADSCNSVIFDNNGRAVLDCENSGYTVSMTFDEDYPTDWFTIRISGTDADSVSLEKGTDGYILRADSIRNLKIWANNRIDTVTAGLSSTKYKSLFIYETDSCTLGLKADTDGNGTYETKLGTYSILENNSVLSAQNIKKGGSVRVSASATGGSGGYTYAVFYKKHSSSKWLTVQGFKENSTVTIKPASAGLYDICVKVRDSNGNVDKKYFSVNVIAPLENDSTISATSISKGSSVIVKADATGGTGSYEYAVYYKKASSSSWSTVQKYKTNSRITITPSAAVVYDICVKVKDSAGSISKKYFTINVVAAPLTNKSTVSSKSIRLGGSVTVKASASGGTGGYRYAVLYKKSDKSSWTTKQSYSTNTAVTIKPAAAVDYDIMVKARDSSGAVENKKFMVSVVR